MSDFIFSLNAVAPLFILMVAGCLAKQLRLVSKTFLTEANKFVFKFSLPLMLFRDIQANSFENVLNSRLVYVALAGIFIIIGLCCCIVPLLVKKKGQQGSIIQAIYRSNFIIYGVPLAMSMYGERALASIALLLTVIIPVYNISAVLILSFFSDNRQEKLSLKKLFFDVLKNPLIIGCMAGLLCGLLHVHFPVFIDKPLSELANIAAPLALFTMGGEFKFKSLSSNLWKVLFSTIARLLLVPALAIGIFVYMGFREIELCALICLFATPTAVVSFIMAENMGCDSELSAQIVVSTTLFSCVTIFFFVYILRVFGYL